MWPSTTKPGTSSTRLTRTLSSTQGRSSPGRSQEVPRSQRGIRLLRSAVKATGAGGHAGGQGQPQDCGRFHTLRSPDCQGNHREVPQDRGRVQANLYAQDKRQPNDEKVPLAMQAYQMQLQHRGTRKGRRTCPTCRSKNVFNKF